MSLALLVYVSSATHLFAQDELVELLRVARGINAREEVTGLLLYQDGNFIQALEGPDEAVDCIYRKIQTDQRHHQVMTLVRGPIETRIFDGWAMGFRSADEMDDADRRSFSEFLTQPADGAPTEHQEHRVQRLLKSFKRSMR